MTNLESYLKLKGCSLPARASTPMKSGYRPEIDIRDELNDTKAAYYQSLIGILRWMVELGCIDITCEVLLEIWLISPLFPFGILLGIDG